MRTVTAAAAAALLLALTGCSPGARSGDAEAVRTPADGELTKAVQAYTRAWFGGDASTAYGMMSRRCLGVADHEAEDGEGTARAGFEATAKENAEKYGPRRATNVTVDETSGDQVRVSYKVDGLSQFDQHGQPWVREGNSWKYDAC